MPRKDLIQNIKRLVIKIGTSSLTEEGEICNRKVSRFVRQVCDVLDEGYQVVIVSSGAITAGAGRIGKKRESLTIPEKQALASVGQALLIELNPNMRFVNNQAIEILGRDKELATQQEHGLNWTMQRAFIKKLYEEIREEPYFIEYMNAPESPDFKKDVNLLKDIFSSELDDNQDLYNILEDQNLYWADDIAYVCNIILAQLSLIKPSADHIRHPDLFKQEDDREFDLQLFMQALTH